MNKNTDFQQNLLGMQSHLMSFAMKLTTDKDEARDLLQDTTLKALDNEEKYVDNVNLKGWLFTIMRNIFINNYRRQSRQAEMTDTGSGAIALSMASEAGVDTPESAYTVAEISQVIAGFPAEYSRPFSMHIAGYKYEEIAEILSTPLGTIKSRIFATRRRLREILADYK